MSDYNRITRDVNRTISSVNASLRDAGRITANTDRILADSRRAVRDANYALDNLQAYPEPKVILSSLHSASLPVATLPDSPSVSLPRLSSYSLPDRTTFFGKVAELLSIAPALYLLWKSFSHFIGKFYDFLVVEHNWAIFGVPPAFVGAAAIGVLVGIVTWVLISELAKWALGTVGLIPGIPPLDEARDLLHRTAIALKAQETKWGEDASRNAFFKLGEHWQVPHNEQQEIWKNARVAAAPEKSPQEEQPRQARHVQTCQQIAPDTSRYPPPQAQPASRTSPVQSQSHAHPVNEATYFKPDVAREIRTQPPSPRPPILKVLGREGLPSEEQGMYFRERMFRRAIKRFVARKRIPQQAIVEMERLRRSLKISSVRAREILAEVLSTNDQP